MQLLHQHPPKSSQDSLVVFAAIPGSSQRWELPVPVEMPGMGCSCSAAPASHRGHGAAARGAAQLHGLAKWSLTPFEPCPVQGMLILP